MRAWLFALVLLSGCSLFGENGTPVTSQVVATTQIDSLSADVSFSTLLQSASAAEQYREQTGLGRAAVPDLDWRTEALYVLPLSLLENERFLVESARVIDDRLDIRSVILRVGPPQGQRRRVLVAVAFSGLPPGVTGYSTGTRTDSGTP